VSADRHWSERRNLRRKASSVAYGVFGPALHEADRRRLVNVEDPGGEDHVPSHRGHDDTNQTFHVDDAHEDSEASGRYSEGRVRCNDSKVTRHCQLHSSTERRAIHGRDHRCRERHNVAQQCVKGSSERVVAAVREATDVVGALR
jgi:hypothetical protein